MSTVYEVADRAGVSTATVSRVVHGSNLVHPDTRDRVLAVIEELGYVPDGSAQGLSRRRKDIIGLAAPWNAASPRSASRKNSPVFMDELVHAVESVLHGTDCSLLLTFGQAGEPFQRRIRSVSGKLQFGAAMSVGYVAVYSGAAGGVSGLVEVMLDNPSNAPVGSFVVGNTAGWSSWETVPANISGVTGTHTVYLEFSSGASGSPPFVSVHYVSFPTS